MQKLHAFAKKDINVFSNYKTYSILMLYVKAKFQVTLILWTSCHSFSKKYFLSKIIKIMYSKRYPIPSSPFFLSVPVISICLKLTEIANIISILERL